MSAKSGGMNSMIKRPTPGMQGSVYGQGQQPFIVHGAPMNSGGAQPFPHPGGLFNQPTQPQIQKMPTPPQGGGWTGTPGFAPQTQVQRFDSPMINNMTQRLGTLNQNPQFQRFDGPLSKMMQGLFS